jgi:hypothetical protein
VKTDFLHGELEEKIYMDQPKGFIVPGKEDLVWKLKMSLYVLKQSPRQWYKRFDSFMLAHEFRDRNIIVVFTLSFSMDQPYICCYILMIC